MPPVLRISATDRLRLHPKAPVPLSPYPPTSGVPEIDTPVSGIGVTGPTSVLVTVSEYPPVPVATTLMK